MLLSLATSLLVLVSIPFLIVVDHQSGASYTVLPTNERTRRDSNLLHSAKSHRSRFKASVVPQPETSRCCLIFSPSNPLPVICQPLLADEDEQSGPSTETSSLLSGPGDIVDDDDAASKKSAHSHCIDITGVALLYKPDFWQLWVLMGLLTGVGLMTIK